MLSSSFLTGQHIPVVSKQAIAAATGRRRRLQLLCAQAASGAQECSKAGQQSGIFISRCSSKLLTWWVSVVAPEPEGRARKNQDPSRGTKFALGGFYLHDMYHLSLSSANLFYCT